MANITLTRIDSRLIHGQVIVKWSRIANGNRIVIVDDELEKDSFMVDIYQMAAPSGMSVEIYSTTRAAKNLKRTKWEKAKFCCFLELLHRQQKLMRKDCILNPCSWVEFRSLQERKRSFQQYPWMKQM